VVSRNVGGMTLGDDPESNGIFRGSIVMRGAIATDDLPDSESFVACLDAALMMNFMNSMSDGISAILMQNFLAGSGSSGSSDHGRQRVHIVASHDEDITNKPAHTTAGNVPI
jgi:hypothetical protein